MDRVRECIVLGRKEKNRAHDGLLKQNPPRGPAPPQASAAPIGMQRVVGRGLRGPSTQSNSMEKKKNRAPVALACTRQTLAGVAVDPLESLSVRARTLGPAPPRLHPRGGRRAACTSAALMATQAVRSRNEGGTSCRGAPAAPAGRAGGRRRGLHLPPEPAEGPPTSRVCRTADCRMATSGVLSITGIITASTPHSITSKEHQQPRG